MWLAVAARHCWKSLRDVANCTAMTKCWIEPDLILSYPQAVEFGLFVCSPELKQNHSNGEPKKGGRSTSSAHLQDQLDRLTQANRDLQKELNGFKSECVVLKRENTELRNQVCRLEEESKTVAAWRNKASHQEKEIEALHGKISDYQLRLSKMASEKMRDDNPTVEDLNDSSRPTALVSRWNGLFRCGEYWTAYENVKKEKGEDNAASILHGICQATYETTKTFVEDLTQVLIVELSHRRSPTLNSADQCRRQTLEEFILDKDERESILRSVEDIVSQMAKDASSEGKGQEGKGQEGKGQEGKSHEGKAILRLLKSRNPPTSLSLTIQKTMGKLEVSPEPIRSFVDQLTELIYYMRVQDIKVVVDFDCKAGTRLNPALYEVESGKTVDNPRSAVVKAVMRPALLRYEHGPVLCKGEVELETSAKPQPGNNSNTPTPDFGTPTAVDLAAFDEKNARQSTAEIASTDEVNKAASQSTPASVVTAEQLQQSSLAVKGKVDPSLQDGLGESNLSAANPLGGVHDDPAEVGPAAPTGTDQATTLAQENTVTDTSLQPSQNDHNQQEVDRSEAATTTAAASPPPADTVITMDDGKNEIGL